MWYSATSGHVRADANANRTAKKLRKFLIILDNESLLYLPGSFLSGNVLMELDDDTPVTGDHDQQSRHRHRESSAVTHCDCPSYQARHGHSNKIWPRITHQNWLRLKWQGDFTSMFFHDLGIHAMDIPTRFGHVSHIKTGLYFHIVGEGVVRLSDRGGASYNDKENYIDFKMRMLGEGPPVGGGGRVMILSPGIHTFPFKLGLPLGLPSTFLAKHGWVQYYCKAELKEASGLTHKNQQVFIVMNPIDLNLEPSLLMQPFHCEIEETVGIPCFTAGKIMCRIRLDRGGYVPGENICIYATIDNSSKVTIRRTRAILTETIQYTAKNKLVQTETRELASLQKGRILCGSGDQWQNELLHIPPLPPTNLRGCHLIRIQYDVYFVIEPKGPDRPIKLQLPIMIATYPVRGKESTLKRRSRPPAYPPVLPVFRPWLNTEAMK